MARKLPYHDEEDWYCLPAVKMEPAVKEVPTDLVGDLDTVVDWLVANFGGAQPEVVAPTPPVIVTYLFNVSGTPVALAAGWLFDATDAEGQGVLIVIYGDSQIPSGELVDLPGIEVITE